MRDLVTKIEDEWKTTHWVAQYARWSDEKVLMLVVKKLEKLASGLFAKDVRKMGEALLGLAAEVAVFAVRHGGEKGISDEIRAERTRQNELHPGNTCADDIPDDRKFVILTEEVGEVARALQEGDGIRSEAVQVAAVCVAWLEAL